MKFWRRVYVWNFLSEKWVVTYDKQIDAFQPFECRFEGAASWCQQPQPYIYEQWWSFVPDTIGTGSGTWSYQGGRVNWGPGG